MPKHQREERLCDEGLSFEEAMRDLQVAVEQLESGELSLDGALAAFERGVHLARCCSTYLDQAELKVRELSPDEGSLDKTPAEG